MAPLPVVYGTKGRIEPLLDPAILGRFADLPQQGKISAEYVWLGGTMQDLRCKTRVLDKAPKSVADLPKWNYDGSSTDQAPGHDSEVYIVPQRIYKDPFRGGENIIVLCDCYEPPRQLPDGSLSELKVIPTNTRAACAAAMEKAKGEEPWFGIEQEYTLLNHTNKRPLGWPECGFPGPQGPYYCSVGSGSAIGRDIVEAHLKACYFAGVKISGVNAEVMPAQWEYQVGPCEGIQMGDDLWMSRYILYRICEVYNVEATFDPKPVPGDWNGAGGHTNFSSKATRADGSGWDAIQEQIKKLEKNHAKHIAAYGEGNERRLTGKHETSSMHDFSWGVANRGASIRVGRSVPVEKSGYYEDRRPASNLDPYVVTKLIVETTLL
uniref:Glutamine synthetase n=1 Tax=Chlorella ellipsoidea TaxID=3072 RepID=D2WS83_CHLEL|nr:glutamine synthetase II [Pseudochlorella pringsheimii]